MSKPSWRDTYNVHPAADAFPMLSEQELRELGEDIKKNGLKTPILFQGIDGKNQTAAGVVLIDGRNRLEAMELVGIEINHADLKKRTVPHYEDAVSHIISLNIHRRHLYKQERSDLIVKAYKATEAKPPQGEEVSHKGGRGKVNETKAKAVATAAKVGISESTVERSFAMAEAEGKPPKPKSESKPKASKPKKNGKAPSGGLTVTLPNNTIAEARSWYVFKLMELDTDERGAEVELLRQAIGTAEAANEGLDDAAQA